MPQPHRGMGGKESLSPDDSCFVLAVALPHPFSNSIISTEGTNGFIVRAGVERSLYFVFAVAFLVVIPKGGSPALAQPHRPPASVPYGTRHKSRKIYQSALSPPLRLDSMVPTSIHERTNTTWRNRSFISSSTLPI